MQEPIWNPEPDEWYHARLVGDRTKRIATHTLFLQLSNGETVMSISSKITQAFAGHTECLPIGIEAAVRVERHTNGYLRALECQLLGDESRPSSTEEVVVISWAEGRDIGRSSRPCGCSIFTVCRDELREGDVVRARIIPSRSRPGLMMAMVDGFNR